MAFPLIVTITEADGTTTQVDNHTAGVPETPTILNVTGTERVVSTSVTEIPELIAHLADILAEVPEPENQEPVPAGGPEPVKKPARKRAAAGQSS